MFACSGIKEIAGSDSTGTFLGKIYQYEAGKNQMMAEIAVYNKGEFVRFSQVYLSPYTLSKSIKRFQSFFYKRHFD